MRRGFTALSTGGREGERRGKTRARTGVREGEGAPRRGESQGGVGTMSNSVDMQLPRSLSRDARAAYTRAPNYTRSACAFRNLLVPSYRESVTCEFVRFPQRNRTAAARREVAPRYAPLAEMTSRT